MLLWALFACESASVPVVAEAPPTPARADVVVITLDTTRADRIGAWGYAGGATSNLDKLAASGLRFARAYSVLPLTIPAHSTLFTGLYPFHTNVRENGAAVLADSFTTLAERFHDAGYATAGSAGAFVTTRQWGFSQGFDAYFDEMPAKSDQPATAAHNYWHTEREGELVVNDALAWLAGVPKEKPVFLWVHLYDAHFPYRPTPENLAKVGGRPYDAELAYVDTQVGRVVDAFASRPTVFAVIGDHGEGLGEHGEQEHGMYTYDSTQHIPWILAGAGVKPGVVDAPVSSADFTPTVLAAAGLPVPDGLDGHVQPGGATVPYAESYQLVDRFRLAPHRMVVDGSLKLIQKPKPELYDVVADPKESTNLADSRPDDVKRLRGLVDGLGAKPPGCDGEAVDADTLAQLTALGYVTGGCGSKVDPESLPDPADFRDFLAGVDRLDRPGGGAEHRASPAETLAKLDTLLRQKPDAYELRMRKSRLLGSTGDTGKARKFMEETLKLFPDDPRPLVQLATMAMADQRPSDALTLAGKALDMSPKDRTARELSVEAQLANGLAADAVASGEAWFDEDPTNTGLAAVLGRFFLMKNDYPKAERYLRAATDGANPHAGSRVQLAALALTSQDRAGAFKLLEAEVADFPMSVPGHRALAHMYGDDRDYLSQLDELHILQKLDAQNPEAQLAVAQCEFNLADFVTARRELDVALRMAPDHPGVLLLQANLLAKEGKAEEGRAVFERADRLHRAEVEASGRTVAPSKSAGRGPAAGASPNTLAAPKVKP